MASYNLIGQRILRKYTAPHKSPTYAATIEAQTIVESLCDVPWQKVADRAARMTYHTEENVGSEGAPISGLEQNVRIRDQFDAALFCAEHRGGQHRAYANAAVYHYVLPDGSLPKLTRLVAKVTSDPYNAAGARIALLTNATGEIPTNCNACRTGDAHAEGVAPRTVASNGNWLPTRADCIFSATPAAGEVALPSGGLPLQKHLFVFVLMESYSTVRGNWLEGSSCIVNQIEIVTNSSITGWTDGALIDLTVDALTEYNVTRGKVLPELTGDVSGVRALTIRSTGDPTTVTLSNPITPEQSCIGLRTLYAALYERRLNAVTKAVALEESAREGAGFSVQCEGTGASIGRAWRVSDVTDDSWNFISGVSALGFPRFLSGKTSYGLVYSYDGSTWLRSNITTGTFASACFGLANGTTPMLVAVSYGNGIYYSYNGIDWTKSRNTNGDFGSCVFFQINGLYRFVAGGNNTAGMWYSDDGITWTQSNMTTGKWNGIAKTNTGRVIAGSYSDDGIIYSDDGINWTQSNITTGDWKGIASDNSGTIVAANFGNGIYVSTDNGVNWTLKKSGGYWSSVAYGNGLFLAASQASDGLWSSTNGNSWTRVKSDGTYFGVAFGDKNFAAASSDNGLWLSYNDEIKSWRLTTAALLVPFAVPVSFRADKVRLDWSGWSGSATPGGKFNVWLKRGTFVQGYPESVLSNPAIYDATQNNVEGYELVGTIDATKAEKTETFDLVNPIDGYVATILLTAFISLDDLNPSNVMNLPQGVATEMDVNADGSLMYGKGTGWKPDITLIG